MCLGSPSTPDMPTPKAPTVPPPPTPVARKLKTKLGDKRRKRRKIGTSALRIPLGMASPTSGAGLSIPSAGSGIQKYA